jgi:hypothetical protein
MTKENQFTLKYYLSSALAGGICCGITHGAVTPVDVVKTRIQLDPLKYNGNLCLTKVYTDLLRNGIRVLANYQD